MGKTAAPGWSTFMPSTRWRMPTSRSVAIRIEPSSPSATSLTFWRIGFGLRVGTTPLTIPNAASNPSRLHRAFMRCPRTRTIRGGVYALYAYVSRQRTAWIASSAWTRWFADRATRFRMGDNPTEALLLKREGRYKPPSSSESEPRAGDGDRNPPGKAMIPKKLPGHNRGCPPGGNPWITVLTPPACVARVVDRFPRQDARRVGGHTARHAESTRCQQVFPRPVPRGVNTTTGKEANADTPSRGDRK